MYCVNKINDDMYWIGGNDRKITVFEGAVPLPTEWPTTPIL